jgi:hypothetical protein
VTTFNLVYLTAAAVGTIALALKFNDLRSRWGSARLWALCATIFFVVLIWWGAAPASIKMINRATGIANFTAPLVYSFVTAFAASALALALFWRYPTEQAWPKVRRILIGYALVIVVIAVFFAFSSVPDERLVDFETFYAKQPTVAIFLITYLLATAAGLATLAYYCFSWARSADYADHPWLRRGLRLLGAAQVVIPVENGLKILAIGANWFDNHSLDKLNTILPMLSSVGILPGVAGIVLPIWGPRWQRWVRQWRAFRILHPMHRAMRDVDPDVVLVGRRWDPHHRVRRQIMELGDWRWTLAPYFDPSVGELAERLGRHEALTDTEVRAAVEAAQLKVAMNRRHADDLPRRTPVRSPADDGVDDVDDGTGLTDELAWWLTVARAFTASPVVDRTVAHALQATGTMGVASAS